MLRIARTEAGMVRGIPAADPRITAFKGIPFAAPPIGNLRWKPPHPPIPWEGIRDCIEFGPISMQVTPGTVPNIYKKEWHVDSNVPMSEDSLQLNIWTPAKTGEERLPVMVWIFGGGLQEGYPSEMEFDGERFARRGVVFVSVNYRLNVFGFLAHPELTAENPDGPCANWGTLDQKAGIDWVRRNIASFGGDPDNITIFGQSAGGGSVLTHLASPMAEGAFQKAIVHSGGGMTVTAPGMLGDAKTLSQAEEMGQKFFDFLGVKSVKEAREIDAVTLFRKHQEFKAFWGFTVDGRYITAPYTEVFLKGGQHKIPVIIGNTSDEFVMKPQDNTIESLRELGRRVFGEDAAEEFVEACMKQAGGDVSRLKDVVKLNIFEIGSQMFCQNAAEKGFNVYYYSFEPTIPGDDAGAFHSVDLWFAFETLAKCWRPFTGRHYDLARQMCTYWTNFAKTGNPNGTDADGTPLPEWLPYNNEDKAGLIFGDEIKMQETGPGPLLSWLVDYNFGKIEHLR